jgi:hypothetical protein
MNYNIAPTTRLFWTLPLVGNDDPVISRAASEYIQGKHGAPYSLTEVLCDLRVRVPLLRIQMAAEKREAARRSHDAAVGELKAAV